MADAQISARALQLVVVIIVCLVKLALLSNAFVLTKNSCNNGFRFSNIPSKTKNVNFSNRMLHSVVRTPLTANLPRSYRSQPLKEHTSIATTRLWSVTPTSTIVENGKGLTCLGIAAAIGILCDNSLQVYLHKNSNGMITLLVSALLVNLKWLPPSHPMYDMAWKTVLPASLALMLVGGTDVEEEGTNTTSILNWTKVYTIGIAFAIACFGSWIGCITSYLVVSCRRLALLPPDMAALAAGCLCASYIGGSVNLFATARIVLSSTATSFVRNHSANTSILTSMAGADLILMAFYFALLTAWKGNARMISFFATNPSTNSTLSNHTTIVEPNESIIPMVEKQSTNIQPKSWSMYKTGATCFLILLTLSLVQLSNKVESFTAIPGAATILITLLGSAVSVLIQQSPFLNRNQQQIVAQLSNQLSYVCFQIFFASLGYSANILETASLYGPALFTFGAIALLVHIAVTFVGCMVWNQIILHKNATSTSPTSNTTTNYLSQLTLQDVMIASNAAIGGPATAASFAGSFPNSWLRRTLVISATLWGVVGYAIGTTVGVNLTRKLLHGRC